jgi:hypothetical protein
VDGEGGGGVHEGRRERWTSSRSRGVGEGEEGGKGRRGRPAGHGCCWSTGEGSRRRLELEERGEDGNPR